MASKAEIITQAYRVAGNVANAWTLDPTVAALYGVADAWLRATTGRGAPKILSGLRSPDKQRDLYRRWQRNDPGVRFKPARQSWHLPSPESGGSRAIDVDPNDPNLDAFRRVWTLFGGRSGHTFGDDNHFDWPVGPPPEPAY